MDAIRQTGPTEATDTVLASQQAIAQSQAAADVQKASTKTEAAASQSTGISFSMVDAFATVGSRSAMRTDIVFGPNSQVAQIRVIDAETHQVISTSPPDSIAHMQMEMQAYQEAVKSKLGST